MVINGTKTRQCRQCLEYIRDSNRLMCKLPYTCRWQLGWFVREHKHPHTTNFYTLDITVEQLFFPPRSLLDRLRASHNAFLRLYDEKEEEKYEFCPYELWLGKGNWRRHDSFGSHRVAQVEVTTMALIGSRLAHFYANYHHRSDAALEFYTVRPGDSIASERFADAEDVVDHIHQLSSKIIDVTKVPRELANLIVSLIHDVYGIEATVKHLAVIENEMKEVEMRFQDITKRFNQAKSAVAERFERIKADEDTRDQKVLDAVPFDVNWIWTNRYLRSTDRPPASRQPSSGTKARLIERLTAYINAHTSDEPPAQSQSQSQPESEDDHGDATESDAKSKSASKAKKQSPSKSQRSAKKESATTAPSPAAASSATVTAVVAASAPVLNE